MNATRTAPSLLWLPKKRAIQAVLVFIFVTAVLTNLVILMTSHTHEDHLDLDLHSQEIKSDADLWGLLHYGDRGSKLKSLRSLRECIRRKMESSQNNRDGQYPTLAWPSYKQANIPPAVDQAMLRSFNWTVQREARRLKSVFRFLSGPVINKHDFHYIHNPRDACFKRHIDLVIAVPSSPEHFESRHRTRQGLKGSYSLVEGNNSTLLFFLGQSNHSNKSRRFQVDINMEMRMFGDIVQETFTDVYHNLTLKAMSVLKWVNTFCPHAQFVIKADDDVGIKPALAVSALKRYREKYGNFILGRWNPATIVMRDPRSKIFVAYEEYPHPTFPPHLLGGAMGFPVTTSKLLYHAALRLKPVWLDDVFISAMCAPRVNVPVFMDVDFDFIHKQW